MTLRFVIVCDQVREQQVLLEVYWRMRSLNMQLERTLYMLTNTPVIVLRITSHYNLKRINEAKFRRFIFYIS